jgi:hypothetical protein
VIYQPGDLRSPTVFVSSAIGGLEPLRRAIAQDLLRVGYEPQMSERSNFPFGPGTSKAFDAAIQLVKACDIYVLVIGRRYGSIHPDLGVSITEAEFIAARDARMPCIAFVDHDVLDGWHQWNAGRIDDRSSLRWVDDKAVWRLVTRVMQVESCPTFSYSDGTSLLDVLHKQMANLFGAFLRFDRGARRWLWTETRTGTMEQKADSVWVLSPDLYWDFQDEHYRDLVHRNVIDRGALYRYLYNETPANVERIAELNEGFVNALGHDEAKRRVYFSPIPEHDFLWCTEHVLFNPGSTDREIGLIVDICEDRDRSKKYDIEMGISKRIAFRRQFKLLWSRYGDGPLPDSSAGASRGLPTE